MLLALWSTHCTRILLPELLLLELILLLLNELLFSILNATVTFVIEFILELLLHWANILIERSITSVVNAVHHLIISILPLTWLASLSNCLATTDIDLVGRLLLLLMNCRLNESWLIVQVDAMLRLQVVYIIVQEGFIVAKFLSNGYQVNVVHCVLCSHCF